MRQKDLVFAFFWWLMLLLKAYFQDYGGDTFFSSSHFLKVSSADERTWQVLSFVRGAKSLCATGTEESGVKRSLAGWAVAVLVIVVVNTITRARATRGSFFFFFFYPALFAYRMDTCSSVHMSPSASWHRKGKTPGTGDSHFSCWGKAGTDSSNLTHSFLFGFFWLDILVFPLIVNSIL